MDLTRFSMEGRTVIVTGGGGGIGGGCARAFAAAGANVVIAGLPSESIPPAVAQLESLATRALGIAIDVTDPAQVDHMVEETMRTFGRIDALLNIAGGSYARNSEMPQFKRNALLDIAPEDFMQAYEVNVKSAFLCSRAVVPHMKARGKGAIVNTGSTSGLGLRKLPGEYSAYGSAKAALHMLTSYMAHQWAPDVRVNCIAPGTIVTPRPAGTVRFDLADAASRIDVGRVGTPDDVAGVALFLASDAAAFVNGIVIPVHGGE